MARNQEEALPYRMLKETGNLANMAGNQIYDAATASTNMGKQAITGLKQGFGQLSKDVTRPFVSRASHGDMFNQVSPMQPKPTAMPKPKAVAKPAKKAPTVKTKPTAKVLPNTVYSTPKLADALNNPATTAMSPKQYSTKNYRDATVNTDQAGDITVGMKAGTVGGANMTPDRAMRIQQSLSQGQQVPGFSMDNYISSMSSDTDGKIMAALHRGDIDTNRASALMNRDFRAADRYDRRGGNMQDYIAPDAAPTDIKSALAFGQKFDNFYRNGEVDPRLAAFQQRNYLDQLGGFKGLGDAGAGTYKGHVLTDTDAATGNETQRIQAINTRTGETKKEKQDNRLKPAKLVASFDAAKSEDEKQAIDKYFVDFYGMTMKEYLNSKEG